ncbi:MAG TPA: arylamine N-acetyltransferase [Bacteroidota bacterium]|nr:arylamine N-acetyltransferase [Bacteroidota bacterium]
MSISGKEVTRYLEILGLPRSAPTLEALTRIVHEHLRRIPFENVSKLYRMNKGGITGLVDCGEFLDGIGRYHFGGTCYLNNFHLHQLLSALGYDVSLCGADMRKPDVHIVNMVKLEGREYLVDVGYAAPFFEPLPCDRAVEYEITFGADRYVLSPRDSTGRLRLSQYRDGVALHGYIVNPAPRRIEEFAHPIAESFLPQATFRNCVLLVKFGDRQSTVLHNLTLVETRGSSVRKTPLGSMNDLIAMIQTHFLIPETVSRVAFDGFSITQGAWG